MKLCRFDLASAPGFPRSGIVYGAKVYETDGTQAIAIHEWTDARLLAPIGTAPSIRLFAAAPEGAEWESGADIPVPAFTYLNPATMFGPTEALRKPEYTPRIQAVPCIGLIIGGAGGNVPTDSADDLVLGLTLVWALSAPNEQGGRATDAGIAVGPAVTTPDELDDAVTVDERGRRYRFSLTAKLNGEEVQSFDMSALPHTPAEIVSYASESCALKQGDLIAMPVGHFTVPLDRGDELQLASDKLGALTTRLV